MQYPEMSNESNGCSKDVGTSTDCPPADILDRDALDRTLLDSLTDLVYVKDVEGKYVVSNLAHARFLGVSSVSEVIGKTAVDFFPPELARKYQADDRRVIETGCEIVDEYEQSVYHDGQSRTMLRTKRPLRDSQGRIIGLIGIARDVTERIRAQESLREMHDTLEKQVAERTAAAEQRAHELSFQKFALDQSAIVAATDARGRITRVNDKFCAISGYTREELIGQDHRIVNSGLHPKEFFKGMYQTIAAGKVWHGEIRNRAKDGTFYWVDTTIVPIVDPRHCGKIEGYIAIRQDITLHKQAQEALWHRTCELEAAIEVAERSNKETGFQKFALDQHAIVAVTDARGRINYVNDKFCEISKYNREELLGQDHRIVNSGLHPKEFFKQMYATIASSKVWHGEIRNRAKDGSIYWVDTTIVPIKDETTGNIKGYVAIRADITALKLTQEHLQAAKEVAEAASQAKGTFLANMSHEIRTPMTAIIGYADLLADIDRPANQRLEFVQTIRRNGEHLLSIINDLLDLSKVEAGKLQIEAIAFNPRQIVTDVESCMRGRADAKGIELSIDLDRQIPRVIHSDPTRLRQVLLNLVSNAIKFTEAGRVRIRVSYDNAGNSLKFDVVDTGIGLSSEQQSALFMPFAQADSSTTRRFGGTGLGLALSKRLVEMLGGQLTAVSERGKGSVFSFTVENRVSTAEPGTKRIPAKRHRTAVSSADSHSHAEPVRGRLLLVEDGADNRRLVTIYLEGAGLTVESAENGQLAIDMVSSAQDRGEPYDVILMDMQMPVMDGYHATAELRRRGFKKVPIIAFTAHALEGERDKCLAAGCNDYSTKPVNPDALIRTIAKQLKITTAAGRRRQPRVGSGKPKVVRTEPASLRSMPDRTQAGRLRSIYLDSKAVKQVLPSYIEGLPQHVAAMAACLASNRLEDLRRLVHQLKGSGGGYGFPDITRVAASAEHAIDVHAEIDKIETTMKELCTLIRSVEGYEPANESISAGRSDG